MQYPNDFINKIILGDCLTIMSEIPDKCCDMILADLPYSILNKRTVWDVIIPFESLWRHYERITKENSAIVLTSSQPFTTQLIASNYKLFRYDLIWEKPLATGFLNANRMPLRSHETICVFYKSLPIYNPQKEPGKPYSMTRRSDTTNYGEVKNLHQTTNNESGDRFPKSVLKFSADKEKLHPTAKPLALGEWLIKTYTNEGQIILDNTCGSGTFCLAAKNTNRNFIGIEKDENFYRIACNRIGQVNEIK
jgi:site-specific DNA-methyltransferase (adenine-specific)